VCIGPRDCTRVGRLSDFFDNLQLPFKDKIKWKSMGSDVSFFGQSQRTGQVLWNNWPKWVFAYIEGFLTGS